MKFLLIAFTILLLTALPISLAKAGGIAALDCQKTVDPVERMTCETPQFLTLRAKIGSGIAKVDTYLSAEQSSRFNAIQSAWASGLSQNCSIEQIENRKRAQEEDVERGPEPEVEQNDTPDPKSKIKACLSNEYIQRIGNILRGSGVFFGCDPQSLEITLNKFFCSSDELRDAIDKLNAVYFPLRWLMAQEHAEKFSDLEETWLANLHPACGLTNKDISPDREKEIDDCLLSSLSDRRAILLDLSGKLNTDAKQRESRPYLLSPIELFLLKEMQRNMDSSSGLLSVNYDGMDRVVNRLVSTIVKAPSDEVDTLLNGISGLSDKMEITADRFLFQEACDRHACSGLLTGLFVDMQTGEVAFARAEQCCHEGNNFTYAIDDNRLASMLYETACLHEEFKEFIASRILKPWISNPTVPEFQILPPTMRVSECVISDRE